MYNPPQEVAIGLFIFGLTVMGLYIWAIVAVSKRYWTGKDGV